MTLLCIKSLALEFLKQSTYSEVKYFFLAISEYYPTFLTIFEVYTTCFRQISL